MSWMPGVVSSTTVSIGLRRLLTSVSPTAGISFRIAARLCSIERCSSTSAALKAQVSTTCLPWVLTTRTLSPRLTLAATPLRAGISSSADWSAPTCLFMAISSLAHSLCRQGNPQALCKSNNLIWLHY
ncbi:hypothetical protein BOS5A_210958 [Bosea sp. EC-HK365B]|nr:hypothetical protein BOSE7B_120818 [Bosea sp. 7B]VVT60167.1 hypothetical protein BOS5A_210958 [Bosea sp. EC-HK365B]